MEKHILHMKIVKILTFIVHKYDAVQHYYN